MASTSINCPGIGCGGKCAGEQVDARGFESPTATTVQVDPCTYLLSQGWTGPQLVERKSRAGYLLPAETTWQHADGLVTFHA